MALTLDCPGDPATVDDSNVSADVAGEEALGIGSSDEARLGLGVSVGVGVSVAVGASTLAEGADCCDPHPTITTASTAVATMSLLFMAGS
jgi:hypothetical protein